MTPAADTDPSIDAELAKVVSLIDAARDHLDSGRGVELSALEGRVEALCAAIRTAPKNDARRYGRQLQDIVVGLDGLTTALDRQFQSLSRQAAEHSPEQAANAYRKPD
jgi:hypothetical protein